MQESNDQAWLRLQAELAELDRELIQIDGLHLKPSQCFHVSNDPAHVLFNTNCPSSLEQRVRALLDKYIPGHETGTPE